MLAAGLTFSAMNVLVKAIPHIPAVEVVFFRSLVSLVLTLTILLRKRIPLLGSNRKVLFLRGVFGTAALTLFFYTLQVMPLASAMVIHYLSPIFTALLAALFLKEQIRLPQYLFFLISFAGIILIKGFDSRVEWLDMLAGVGAALLSGAAYNCIRWLKFGEDSHVIIFYFPLIAMPTTLMLTLFVTGWVAPEPTELLILIAIGVLTQFAQFFLTRAYQSEEAGTVAAVTNVGIIYALLLGWLFFGELFGLGAFGGMVLVVAGVLLNVFYREHKKRAAR
ncbi:MAG: DMT family transporter [Flavobacteriales bacterium]|nr:DMT family transporter [Flavobacteriales bacterium]